MIIITRHTLEVGKRYPPPGVFATLGDANYNPHFIPFVVIKEVTKQDYINYCDEVGAIINGTISEDDKFYQVSID